MRTFIILSVILFLNQSEARVFDITKASVATYFHFRGSPSTINQTPFEKSGGTGLTFGDQYRYNYFGEIGVMFLLSGINFRLGLDIDRPNQVVAMPVKNAAQTTLYTLNSSVFGVGGVLGVDVRLGGSATSSYYLGLTGGMSRVALKNEYTFTADGVSTYGLADFIEEGSATGYFGQVGLGFEILLSDNVTFTMDGGYRYQNVQGLKHERAYNKIGGGAVAVGDAMQDNDGTDRVLNLSGAFIGAGLRFYLSF